MKLEKEDKAGLYITVIFHLAVIIVLLLVQIGREIGRENTFVLDFTKQEELEKQEKEELFKEDISRKLDELLASSPSVANVKNMAVDARASLKDDRNTDAEQLYKDAERLAQELKNGQSALEENAMDEAVDIKSGNDSKPVEKKEYKGPSVLSYSLDGRKATHLPIPAYRCMGGGQVTVIIKVNNQGTVVMATPLDDVSSSDPCLRNYAVRAARMSKFNASTSAPANQVGEIVYLFLAQ